LHSVISDNPLKQKERTYPADLTYLKSRMYKTVIEIPDNYKIAKIPENKILNSEKFMMQQTFSQSGNTLVVQAYYQFNETVFYPDEYETIRDFFSTIITCLNQDIVIEKID
jgi:hypothetical protein